jgi:hypothetical protein
LIKRAFRLAAVLCGVAAAAGLSASVLAEEFRAGALTIDHPWARASIGTSKNSAAYMKISNSGDAPDRLTGVKIDTAEHAMLHESRMEGDVMKMVHLSGGIEIPAHGSAELKPLGLHVMVMGLKAPLKDGETLPLTLVFEKAGEVQVTAAVGKTSPQ